MKKFLVLVLAFVLASTAVFAVSDADYRAAKKAALDAEAAGDTGTAISNYIKAATVAGEIKNKKGEAWQYNTAAFTLIKSYKAITAFDAEEAKLAALVAGKEKWALQTALANTCKANEGLLDQAAELLAKAEAVGLEEAAGKITSNKAFIEQQKKFITDTLEPKKEEAKVEEAKVEAAPAVAEETKK